MSCMGYGLKDKSWAQSMVQRNGGRPHRSMVLALLLDMPEDAWKSWGRDVQSERLAPYVLEGESIRFSTKDDEAFIVPDALGGMGRSASSELTIDEMQAEKAAVGMWVEAKAKLTRAATQEAFVIATIDMAREYVELERLVLKTALDPKATVQERRLASANWKDFKDRHMGKAVAPTEDVTQKPSDIRGWMASQQPSSLPVSAMWTPESIANEQLKELEAGTLEGDEATS